MDYAALKSEILTDPAGLGYAGKSPAEIVALMADAVVQQECRVSLQELQAVLMSTIVPPALMPAWWILKSQSSSNQLAEMAFDLFGSRLESLDVRADFTKSAIAGLLTSGVIDDAIVAKIAAMSFKATSRGIALFGRAPNSLDVQVALLPE